MYGVKVSGGKRCHCSATHVEKELCKLLREKEFCILINLQRRKHTYLYSSVRAKKEIKLESN